MAEFPDDAADFKADLERLGVSGPDPKSSAAHKIGYSVGYISDLMRGRKPYSLGLRTKLGEMIADKANGPVDQDTAFAPIIARADDDACEPRFHVTENNDGGWDVVEKVWVLNHSIVAKVPSTASESNAERIADLLNKEAG